MGSMNIVHTNDANLAADLRNRGFVPIECSFGATGSVVDDLYMDHHGEYSHLKGVAVRAYCEHFGVLREAFLLGDARFVVTGAADADACFAIAALIGELPHPSRAAEYANAPEPVRKAHTRSCVRFAELVNRVDTAPIGVRLEEEPDGPMLLLWNQLSSSTQDSTAFYAGVDRWRSLFARAPQALLQAAQAQEQERVDAARQAQVLQAARCPRQNTSIVLVQSPVWGFDVWYAELGMCIMALTPTGSATIGCENEQAAESLFGPGGLKNVFPKLKPFGWGGRETIGGSPRGLVLTQEQVDAAMQVLQECVK